jgi:hypothetical protein
MDSDCAERSSANPSRIHGRSSTRMDFGLRRAKLCESIANPWQIVDPDGFRIAQSEALRIHRESMADRRSGWIRIAQSKALRIVGRESAAKPQPQSFALRNPENSGNPKAASRIHHRRALLCAIRRILAIQRRRRAAAVQGASHKLISPPIEIKLASPPTRAIKTTPSSRLPKARTESSEEDGR